MISALYIVKNEQELIAESLQSIASIANEIVIIDTGSVDDTLKIAQNIAGVRIFNYKWPDDFSKARNFGLHHCRYPWVLYLDADEKLDKESAAKILQATTTCSSSIGGMSLHVMDYTTNWGKPGYGQPSFFKSPQLRVFRRLPGAAFQNPVLETIEYSIRAKRYATNLLDATVHHYLWRGKGEELARAKIRYYNQLGARLQLPTVTEVSDEEATESVAKQALVEKEQPKPQASKSAVPIVICAYNALEGTKECLPSLRKNTDFPYIPILVNNGSRDGTQDYMREFLGFEPLTLERNVGVAKGRNIGAREAMIRHNSEFICFLDNDTKLSPGWLGKMVKILNENPEIGIVGPLTGYGDGEQNVQEVYLSSKMEEVGPKVLDRDPEFIEVDQVEGFCMLIRTDLARKIGLFDETLGLYGNEDHDFCLRAKEAGAKIAIANRVFVEHFGKLTLRSNRVNWNDIKTRSTQVFKTKWKKKLPSVVIHPMHKGNNRIKFPMYSGPLTPRVSIVVLTHNRLDMTQQCLESIFKYTVNYEMIVVDNGSTDGTLGWLSSKSVKVIKNGVNLGIPIARNQGIKAASSKYIVLIDNDVVVKPNWLADLFTGINSGADIVGIEGWRLDKTNWAACYKCVAQTEPFDYLGGACCLFKRSVFEQVGLLDEGFSPAYYEDPDICMRATKAGCKLAFIPTKNIEHRQHATLIHGQKSFNYQDALAKSHLRFAKKMNGELKVEHEMLPHVDPKLKLLYLAMEWDYGQQGRGYSYEHDNFYSSFAQWPKIKELHHFDYVALAQQHGVDKMSSMLLDKVQQVCPDAIFMIAFNEANDPRKIVMQDISKTTPTKTIGWFCDSHWRYDTFDKQWAPYLDFVVTTSTVAQRRFVNDGFGKKVIKSQWAASPKYTPRNLPQDVQVSFVGQPHGDRRQVVDELKRAGIPLQVYGTGWGKRLTFEEMIAMFSRSKINLNLNNACDAHSKQIKGRNFEVPACGGMIITGDAENLSDYYKFGEEIAVYGSTPELIETIKYYLKNEQQRAAIARAGYERTMAEHTYNHRYDQIFSQAGLI